MIVRTYGRRNRCVGCSFSEDEDLLDQSQDSSDAFSDIPLPPSSQDQDSSPSAPWSLDPHLSFWADSDSRPLALLDHAPAPAPARPKRCSRHMSPSSSLMEAQEFGEMMEHVDKVNFAVDGLRRGLPARVRRSSLLSLLSISFTSQHRRLLRAQGLAKKVVDAVLALDIDDTPSMLAAATLFYVLASDGQDDNFLDSNPCIDFLLKLLNPPIPAGTEEKKQIAGGKLLSVCRDPCIPNGLSSKVDSSSRLIFSKVMEILVSCKEIRTRHGDIDAITRPELDSKWISLLTIEKACLSTISLEERAATVRRIGGNFKEKFREYGGLDAIFDLAANCHMVMEKLSSCQEYRKDLSKCLVLLLKCLKIMENATFLSKENQSHLLNMSAKLDADGMPVTFVGLLLSAIKILSDLFLLKSSSIEPDEERTISMEEKLDPQTLNDSKINTMHVHRGEEGGIMARVSIKNSCIEHVASPANWLKEGKKRKKLFFSQSEFCSSDSAATSMSTSDVYPLDREGNSSASVFSDGKLSSLNGPIYIENGDSKPESVDLCGRSSETDGTRHDGQEDSQNPFTFVEDEFEPSKWELLSTQKAVHKTPKSSKKHRGNNLLSRNGCKLQIRIAKIESTIKENVPLRVVSGPSCIDDEDSDLLGDCLLTAVKVLMNLTNDNPEGCRQIASCGGLDIMASLIVGHFPMFSSTDLGQDEKYFDDQELEFLVAILGLLVNLVEKNSQNRSRLSVATVPLCISGRVKGKRCQQDVIRLFCSIFLANQGDNEAIAEGNMLPWTDEDTIVQGQREAEKMIIEAYAALLLAFLSTESANVRDNIARCLPDQSLEVLVPVLERFVAFHLTLNMISPETHATVTKVIESCREA